MVDVHWHGSMPAGVVQCCVTSTGQLHTHLQRPQRFHAFSPLLHLVTAVVFALSSPSVFCVDQNLVFSFLAGSHIFQIHQGSHQCPSCLRIGTRPPFRAFHVCHAVCSCIRFLYIAVNLLPEMRAPATARLLLSVAFKFKTHANHRSLPSNHRRLKS